MSEAHDAAVNFERRVLLFGGCAAVVGAIAPGSAGAFPESSPAPRAKCDHEGCRFYRLDEGGEGLCGLALHGGVIGL